jgi:hypothetical protein
VDEETLSVKLIHHSVKQFLLSGPNGVAGQTFTIQDANKTMAGVVMTYLDYGIFDTQLSNRVIPQVQHEAIPMKVVSSVLDSSTIQKLALRLVEYVLEDLTVPHSTSGFRLRFEVLNLNRRTFI